MEIRGVHESELEEMIDLQCRVFRPDGHERYLQYVRAEPSYRHDQSRVLVVNKEIVSTLRVWEREMRIGSVAVPMGGIGGGRHTPQPSRRWLCHSVDGGYHHLHAGSGL